MEYDELHAAVGDIVTPSQLRQMEALVTFNVSRSTWVASGTNHTADSEEKTRRNETAAYPMCPDPFQNESRPIGSAFQHIPSVKTVVEMEHVLSHPLIKIYARQSGMGSVLENPNLLRELKSKKNKLLNVLFLDMSLISLLDTKIYCSEVFSEESMRLRLGVAFGKTLNAMQLSSIPSYLTHVSAFAKQALNSSSIIFRLVDKNFTSAVLHINGKVSAGGGPLRSPFCKKKIPDNLYNENKAVYTE